MLHANVNWKKLKEILILINAFKTEKDGEEKI
jgi:hypothetical protein